MADWHMIFVFAAVLAVVASVVAAFALPGTHTRTDLPRFDYLGAALLTPGLVALLYGITQGPTWGWGSFGVLASSSGGSSS